MFSFRKIFNKMDFNRKNILLSWIFAFVSAFVWSILSSDDEKVLVFSILFLITSFLSRSIFFLRNKPIKYKMGFLVFKHSKPVHMNRYLKFLTAFWASIIFLLMLSNLTNNVWSGYLSFFISSTVMYALLLYTNTPLVPFFAIGKTANNNFSSFNSFNSFSGTFNTSDPNQYTSYSSFSDSSINSSTSHSHSTSDYHFSPGGSSSSSNIYR